MVRKNARLLLRADGEGVRRAAGRAGRALGFTAIAKGAVLLWVPSAVTPHGASIRVYGGQCVLPGRTATIRGKEKTNEQTVQNLLNTFLARADVFLPAETRTDPNSAP